MPALILYNGKILTQDPALPQASAIAIRGNRILAVGTDQDILALANRNTRQIDLDGRLALPGFTDAHFHYYKWAIGRQELPLAGIPSREALLERLAEKTLERAGGQWIQGQGWLETFWPDPRLLRKEDLDRVSPKHPVILYRSDGHLAVVNSLGLHAAGIGPHTPDPPHGVIDRDEQGIPTGVLRELAINLVRNNIKLPADETAMQAMLEGFDHLHRLGITGVHDFRSIGGKDGPPALRAWQALQSQGRVGLRAWVTLPGEHLDEAIGLGLRTGFGNDYMRIGHIKYFADGSQGARTAWMLDPYLDTGTYGLANTSEEEISENLHRAEQAGLAIAIHAIGDRANREVIQAFANNLKDQKRVPLALAAPHRLEHAQNLRPEDVSNLARLKVVVSVQPVHLRDDILPFEKSVGDRGRYGYVFQDMIQSGTILAMGSDCPVADPNPLQGIYSAVARKGWDFKPEASWYPNQRTSVAQAVQAYTMGAAAASGWEVDLGSLSPYKLADLVCLDRDIYSISAEEILETNVDLTLFDGEVVYQR